MSLPGLVKLRRDLLYLKDAIVHTERALLYVSDIDLNQLEEDSMRFDAVLRNLQIIGEAVKQIPDDLRDLQPQIPWTKIAGIRNLLVHHYFHVDSEIVTDICRNHLLPLRDALRAIAAEFPELMI